MENLAFASCARRSCASFAEDECIALNLSNSSDALASSSSFSCRAAADAAAAAIAVISSQVSCSRSLASSTSASMRSMQLQDHAKSPSLDGAVQRLGTPSTLTPHDCRRCDSLAHLAAEHSRLRTSRREQPRRALQL